MIRPELQLALPSVRPAAVEAYAGSTVMARMQRSGLFREYQQAFEATTGLPLALREAGSFRTPLQGSSRVNPFCALMTQTNQTCAACLQLQQRLEQEATQGPKSLQCHAGLTESAVPIRVGDTVLGYLQTGQIFLQSPSKKRFADFARGLPNAHGKGASRALKSAYFQTRVLPAKQYASTIRLLAVFAEHLATVSNQLLLRESDVEPAAITRGRRFIAEHHAEELSLGEVARAAHMSASYFCRLFKQTTGVSFTEYLTRARLESAKQMMLDAHRRISEAAFAAGFQSLSQFNRVFRRIAGETPSNYRDRLHGVHGKPARAVVLVPAARTAGASAA